MRRASVRLLPWIFILVMVFFMGFVVLRTKAEQGTADYPSMQNGTEVYPSMQGGTEVYPSSQGSAEVYPSMQGIDISGADYAVNAVVKTIDDAVASSVSGIPENDLMFIQEWDITSDTYPLNVMFYVPGTQNLTMYVFSDSDNGWTTVKKGNGSSLSVTFTQDTHAAVYVGPSLLTSFTIEDLEIVEETGGFIDNRWNEETQQWEEYYQYQLWNASKLKITVTYDGKTYSGSASELNNQLAAIGGYVWFTDSQWEEPWVLGGTYEVTGTLMGVSKTFHVSIVSPPLEKLSVENLTLMEGSFGYMTSDPDGLERYFKYSLDGIADISFTYDGKPYHGTVSEIQNIMYQLTGSYVSPIITTDQSYTNQWVPEGAYTASVSFLGEETSVTVQIIETPFRSITAEDITVIKGADGYMGYDYETGEPSFFRYEYTPAVRLTDKNGEEVPYEPSPYSATLIYEDQVFPVICSDDQDENHWDLGEHQVSVWCGGLETTFTVTVVETPVASLQVEQLRAYEGVGLTSNQGLQFPYTIVFKDGTTKNVERSMFQYNGKTYSLHLQIPEGTSEWTAGDIYYIQASILGFSTDIPVEVYGIDSIEVQEDNGLKLLIHQTNEQTAIANIRCFDYRGTDAGTVNGFLRTDMGTFNASVINYGTNQNVQIEIAGNTSNVLPTSKWMETNRHAMNLWYLGLARNNSFNGTITEDNIDNIIFITLLHSSYNSLSVEADIMKEMIQDLFVVTSDFDMSLSSYYDAEKDMIIFPRGGIGGNFDCCIISTDTEQGFINYSSNGPENDMTILFDENYKIKQFGKTEDTPEDVVILDFIVLTDLHDENTFIYHPDSYTMNQGDEITFGIVFSGLPGSETADAVLNQLTLFERIGGAGRMNEDGTSTGFYTFRAVEAGTVTVNVTDDYSVQLNVIETPIRITKQPENVNIVSGNTATFSIEAEGDGLTYQWYYKLKDAAAFRIWKNRESAEFSYVPTEDKDGMEVCCMITDEEGNTATSEIVTLTFVENPIKITRQPENVSIVLGANASFSVEAEGEELTYQWYYRLKDAATFRAWKNRVYSDFSYVPTEDKDGMEVCCLVTDGNGNSVTSEKATLTFIENPISIIKQPEDVNIVFGATAAFSIEAEGEGLTYQWYYRLKDAATFRAWKNRVYSDFSYVPTEDKDGMEVRCLVTDCGGNTITSEIATLTFLENPISIIQQPENVSISIGESAAFSIEAEGEGLTYQWYYKLPGKKTFTLWKNKTTAEFSYVPKADKDGMEVYCLITDSEGNTRASEKVTLRIS